jgi:hypothetical protein
MRSLRIFVLLTLALLLTSCQPNRSVTGSTPNLPGKEIDVADFNAIEVSSALNTRISQGDTFKVTVYAGKDLIDQVQVQKVGSSLRLSLDSLLSLTSTAPEIHITLPRLDELHVNGASRAEITHLTAHEDVLIIVSGASQVQGTLDAAVAKFDVSGASNVRLDGSADNVILTVSGASRLDLHSFRTRNVQAELSGASSAQANVTGNLDYRLSGASHLTYQGRPAINVAEATGGSSATKD